MSAVGVDGAAITVPLPAGPREMIFASDEVAARLEDLTMTLGEGPGVEALDGCPALASDLAATDGLARWPMFAPAAASAGVRAVFALPLRIGGIRVGVMNLYRVEPGGLDGEYLADALVLADTACALLLDAAERDKTNPNGHWPHHTGLHEPEVHQATGMIIVQLGVSTAVALIRLRAYAYAHDRRLGDVARDVVARRLRFEPETCPASDSGEDHGGE